MENLPRYNKFLVVIAGGTVSILSYFYADASWLPVLTNLLTMLGVYAVPNKKS